jgi:hypothetical protein
MSSILRRNPRPKVAGRACALAILVSLVAATASAQEAPPVARPHDADGLFPEPRLFAVGMDYAAKYLGGGADAQQAGFYPTFGGLYPGAGWLSLGSGYRARWSGDTVVVDASAALSWRGYKLARGRLEFPALAHGRMIAGLQATWQDFTQVNYFGTGSGSLEQERSEYRVTAADVVGFASYRPARWLTIAGRGGRLFSPTLSPPSGPFDRGYPNAADVFAADSTFALSAQPDFLHAETSVTADTRDYAGHPMRGGFYRAAWTAYLDRAAGRFGWRGWEIDALQVVPVYPERLTLLTRVWTVGSLTPDDQRVPVYLLPSLGGGNTLRSFPDFRFHDRNLLLATVESRIALLTHVDLAVFTDAGSVAPRFGDLTLNTRSHGAGLRFHSHSATIARIEAARGREGWYLFFSLNDPFRFGRQHRTAAPVPFAP